MAAQRGIAWPLLVAASAFIRLVLVQFVGDVAIYVMPYKVDAFNDLRKEIKEAVYKVAHAVYALTDKAGKTEYDRVIVVGHSLGSVIAYDALNRLIHEDRVALAAEALHIVDRTRLFLTFGSPLDKTAFIFGAQGHGTTEARESLAASVQPLIQSYDYRPEQWINIYSPVGHHQRISRPLRPSRRYELAEGDQSERSGSHHAVNGAHRVLERQATGADVVRRALSGPDRSSFSLSRDGDDAPGGEHSPGPQVSQDGSVFTKRRPSCAR